MASIKDQFPIFEKNPTLVYLDSGATTLKPLSVLQKMMEYYADYSSNIHRGLYPISERATEEYEKVRDKIVEFIGAKFASEIIFTSGTTSGLNLVARGWGDKNLIDGDEVVVTEMEHHSNLVPWQELAKRKNLKLKFLPIVDFHLDMSKLKEVINENTKLLAVTHVSNVLGTVNPVKEIVRQCRMINPSIIVVVDGAQAVSHIKVDVGDMDVDFYAFSGHKMYGPTGVGVLYTKASRQLEMDPESFGGGMIKEVLKEKSTWANGPEKFEAGTPPIAEVIGLGASVDFLQQMGMENLTRHEKEITDYAMLQLVQSPQIKVVGPQKNRIGVISIFLNKDKMGTAHDWSSILGSNFNVCVRAGHHCAMPLHELLGLPWGTLRASIGIYNTKEDIDVLVKGLLEAERVFEEVDNG